MTRSRITHAEPTGELSTTADRRQFLRRTAMAAGAAAAATGTGLIGGGAARAQEQPATVGYVPYAEPFRTYDSRNDPDGRIERDQTYVVDMSELTDTGAAAVTINLTIVNTANVGFLVVYGQGRNRPGVSTINWWDNNQVMANMVTIATGTQDNDLAVYCGAGATHFIVDVYGYYT